MSKQIAVCLVAIAALAVAAQTALAARQDTMKPQLVKTIVDKKLGRVLTTAGTRCPLAAGVPQTNASSATYSTLEREQEKAQADVRCDLRLVAALGGDVHQGQRPRPPAARRVPTRQRAH